MMLPNIYDSLAIFLQFYLASFTKKSHLNLTFSLNVPKFSIQLSLSINLVFVFKITIYSLIHRVGECILNLGW